VRPMLNPSRILVLFLSLPLVVSVSALAESRPERRLCSQQPGQSFHGSRGRWRDSLS